MKKSPRQMWHELAPIDRSVVLIALLLVAGTCAIAAALTTDVSPASLSLRSSTGP